MMRISQQARWCRRPASSRHARAALEEIWKTIYIVVLLTITAVTGATGNRTAAQAGHSAVMTCPHRTGATMVTWKISPKIGGPCTLVFRADQNLVHRTNCSDSVKSEFKPEQFYALEIQQVGMADEGNYSCEVVNQEGNFHQMYQLTVLVPPRLSLYCDNHSIPVCEAAAGRPAAEILWVPENSSTTEIDSHDNGTVTVLSRFTAHSTDRKTVTCKVYHATLNETMSTDCSSSQSDLILYIAIALGFLIIITFMAVIYYFKLHGCRLCHKTKPPDTSLTHSLEDDTTEVEPYTTYVQKENTIYNSVSDLTGGQNLP
nr:cell surface glycoprotein CD200 receptor 1-A isoform X1 [Anas platyrhynchos]XP_038038162.1 cell surface glycoprotein CD200 receptor 1-A isoform X1 [Anas platyrhynchos]XP_038038164.1 cell surface glycoprotein CD200 receptor 1-A isoform X1 [Anas platyrhynchos]